MFLRSWFAKSAFPGWLKNLNVLIFPKPKKLHKKKHSSKLNVIESCGETQCYVEDGFRKVVPYKAIVTIPAKERWVGKTLREIYLSEFEYRFRSMGSEEDIIRMGKLAVNNKKIKSFDRVIKRNNRITKIIHKHEEWVVSDAVEILVNNDNFVVVNKPCSIPVHPSGSYRHNSLLFILAKEHNLTGLYYFNRIDKLTSGLTILAKSKEKVVELSRQIQNKQVYDGQGTWLKLVWLRFKPRWSCGKVSTVCFPSDCFYEALLSLGIILVRTCSKMWYLFRVTKEILPDK